MSYLRLNLTMAVFLFLGTGTLVHAEAPSADAIEKAAEKYVDPDTNDSTREKLIALLAQAKNEDVADAVKSSFRKEDERPYALRLALALHLRGLFKKAKKYLTSYPEEIASLGLITNDKGAHEDLQKEWAAAGLDGELFRILTTAFKQHGINLDGLSEFHAVLEDDSVSEERKQIAAEILSVQMGETTTDPVELSVLWEDFKSSYKTDGQQFDVAGYNSLESAEFESANATRVGMNRKLSSQGQIDSTWPSHLFEQGYTVSMWVKFSSDFDGSLGLKSGPSANPVTVLGPRIADGKAVFEQGGGIEALKIAIKPDEWTQFTWQITSTKSSKGPGMAWGFVLTMDGKPSVENRQVHTELGGFKIQALKGSCIVSSVDYVRH